MQLNLFPKKFTIFDLQKTANLNKSDTKPFSSFCVHIYQTCIFENIRWFHQEHIKVEPR